MPNKRDEDAVHLIGRLSDDVLLARKICLEHTARLLEIAILDIQTTVYGISNDELLCFVDAMNERKSNGQIHAFIKKRSKLPKASLSKALRD
jgi:hypothetical protein